MPVYMIRAGEHGPVKIGYSDDPQVRLGQLQISHWETLRIIRLFEGGEPEEVALHARFSDLYIRGEWHHFSRAMLSDVGLVEIVAASAVEETTALSGDLALHEGFGIDIKAIGERLARSLKHLGLFQKEAGRKINASQTDVSLWCSGVRRIPPHQALKLHRVFGLQLSELRPDIWPAEAGATARDLARMAEAEAA